MRYQLLVSQWQLESTRVRSEVETELSILSGPQLDYAVHPKKWTIRQCLQHLVLFNRYFLHEAAAACNTLNGTAAPAEFTMHFTALLLMQKVNLERSGAYRTRSMFDPAIQITNGDVFEHFQTTQNTLDHILVLSQQVNYNVPYIPADRLGLFRLSLGELLWYIIEHEKKHLRQATYLACLVPDSL